MRGSRSRPSVSPSAFVGGSALQSKALVARVEVEELEKLVEITLVFHGAMSRVVRPESRWHSTIRVRVSRSAIPLGRGFLVLAVRCWTCSSCKAGEAGHRLLVDPEATSLSPSTFTRSGAPPGSASSSASATGCRKRRECYPIGSSRPVRVSRSLSSRVSTQAPRNMDSGRPWSVKREQLTTAANQSSGGSPMQRSAAFQSPCGFRMDRLRYDERWRTASRACPARPRISCALSDDRASRASSTGGTVEPAASTALALGPVVLGDPDPGMRHSALDALARDGSETARPYVESALADEDARVRDAARRALSDRGDARPAGAPDYRGSELTR